MHVKISKKGRSVINDKKLASEVVLTVVNNQQQLEEGKTVRIEGRNMGVKLVTTVKDSK
ncbi:MAG TPA: hypothetical protein VLS85_01655 [Hanamia sp.]|nr:hypothetical protein [Hanamia sp.]